MGNSNGIKQNLTQVILIVFSVVLGLFLSERIEERKDKQLADNLLAKIKSEVNDNRKLVKEWVVYHQAFTKNLDSLATNEQFIREFIGDKFTIFRLLPEETNGTFMGRLPSNDAWDIAKSHPLTVNIDYDKLLILSKIYTQQKLSFEPMVEMFELFKSKDFNIEKNAKSSLNTVLENMYEQISLERQLIYYYDQGKKILELDNLEDNGN